jgi:hypothetical protein
MTVRPERGLTGSSGIGSLTPGKRPDYYRLGALASASNGTLDPVEVSMDSHYGTFIPLRPPGAKGTRWAALLVWEHHA